MQEDQKDAYLENSIKPQKAETKKLLADFLVVNSQTQIVKQIEGPFAVEKSFVLFVAPAA